MANDSYFVKIRGRVLGPFPTERLVQMVAQGSLSRIHMLSTDGNSWQRASEFPQLFEVEPVAKKTTQSAKATQVSTQPESTGEDSNAEDHQALWYYGINDQSTGPVSKTTIVNLLKSGQLSNDDMLWRTGMDDWQPVNRFPDFGNVVQATKKATAGAYRGSASSRGSDSTSRGDHDLLDTVRILQSNNPWVMFVTIVLYFFGALQFVSFLFGLVHGTQNKDGVLIAGAIFSLLQMVVTIVAAVFLNRHVSLTGRFVMSRQIDDLNASLEWLGRFWLIVSIIVIITIIFLLIGVIYFLTVNNAVFG